MKSNKFLSIQWVIKGHFLQIILVSLVLSGLFIWLRGEKPLLPIFLLCFIMLCLQLKIFLGLTTKILKAKQLAPLTTKEFIRRTIMSLFKFYLSVFFLSILTVLLVIGIFAVVNNKDLKIQLQYLLAIEFMGFVKMYFGCLLLSALVHFYFLWRDALNREQKLREEKLLFQFETLKSQVNPHFLFNSLNTLSLLVSTDALMAERFIQKLSDIYHYVLENQEKDTVDLMAEINFVKDYFYLQQIRDEDTISLSIEVEDSPKYKILPISLQLLVENALKHNLATSQRPLNITIHLVKDTVVVKNNLQQKNTVLHSGKIGLENLRQRVKHWTGRELEITETKADFNVVIPLIVVT